MAYNPVTDTPFSDLSTPPDTLLVSNIPSEIRQLKSRINEVAAGLYNQGPAVGVISIWGTGTPPANFIECNGQSLTASYFSRVRSIYGNNAPDYRGWFLRGWAHGKGSDNGSEIDYGRAIGSGQWWQVGYHNHNYDRYSDNGNSHHIGHGSEQVGPNQTTQTSGTGGNDNRPANIAVMYIMRYQ